MYTIDTNKKSSAPSDGSVASATRNPALAAALREMEAKKKQGPWRRRLKISGIALVMLLVVGGGAWAIKAKLNANAKAKVLASIQQDPRQMRDAIESGKITREEAWDARQQAFEARMDKQMDEYFALPAADRTKYLDKLIDDQQKEWEQRRKEREARAATRPATTQPRRASTQPTTRPNRFDSQRQLSRVQGGNPVRKAQRAEFMAAMRQRMAQRGITNPQGRGGWGGGGGMGGGGRGPGGGGGGRRG